MDSSATTQVPVAGERWRELTLQANAQHAARDYRGALRLYNAAFGEAEAVLGRELRQPDSQRVIGPLPSKVGKDTFLLVPDGDYANTTIYRVTGSIDPMPVLKTKGWSMRLFQVR